jgi:hypothetical protein
MDTVFEYSLPVKGPDSALYHARARGFEREDTLWEGFIEFESLDGTTSYHTLRETTQPNLSALVYWATGLSQVFLEGAIARAADASMAPEILELQPLPPAILNPYAVYAKGEAVLRFELNALASWHLRNIARAHHILSEQVLAGDLSKAVLVEAIVTAVRVRADIVATPM